MVQRAAAGTEALGYGYRCAAKIMKKAPGGFFSSPPFSGNLCISGEKRQDSDEPGAADGGKASPSPGLAIMFFHSLTAAAAACFRR